MLAQIIRNLFSNDLIVELKENLICIRSFSDDREYADKPYIAVEKINSKIHIREFGEDSVQVVGENILLINPFSHPRSILSSSNYAERIVKHGIRALNENRLKVAPRVIIHPLEKVEGGLTDVEDRALREVALAAGARHVTIYCGDRINVQIESYEDIEAKCKAP